MKYNFTLPYYSFIFTLISFCLFACDNTDNTTTKEGKTLSIDTKSIEFSKEASSYEIHITTNVENWLISTSNTNWLTLSTTSGGPGTTNVSITTLENKEIERTAEVIVNANGIDAVKIFITQTGIKSNSLYPNYNISPIDSDQTGMTKTAEQIASEISLGWNIGNSLEAIGSETAWGNPIVSKELIDFIKLNGFNAVRIPCSWNQYLSNSSKAEISNTWLNRVKEVVQYCIDNDLYVLLNIHWDGGWLEENCTIEKQDENNAKQKAFWEQIATHLREFDEHLLFASANEPHAEDAIAMTVLNSYHQTFIDAVRSTGGKNTYRTLVIQGPKTDILKTNELMTSLPTDSTQGRLMAEVHYYSPWQFAGLTADVSWGNMSYYWGDNYQSTIDPDRNATWANETDLANYFTLMKTQFIDQGIPVILGEFGAIRRSDLTGDALSLHLDSRAYYLKSVVKQAKANGLLPFYWDEGSKEHNGFGIIDRTNNTVFDQQALTALLQGLE